MSEPGQESAVNGSEWDS